MIFCKACKKARSKRYGKTFYGFLVTYHTNKRCAIKNRAAAYDRYCEAVRRCNGTVR